MMIEGSPDNWADLLDPLVPQILELVIGTWQGFIRPTPDEIEDRVSIRFCAALRKGPRRSEYQFQIHTQIVILEPEAGEELGRLDIAFLPLVSSEEIYFCLECKRLNVAYPNRIRPYTGEYVRLGMLRFVTGQYSQSVRHGGMLGYVYDGDVDGAMANIQLSIKERLTELGMDQPGEFQPSSFRRNDPHTKETHHRRQHSLMLFRLHHMFVSCPIPSAPVPPTDVV
jgi:hypothetical protein